MGIFFDTCNALVDPATGRALTGEALEKAQNDPKWPRCGNRVSKRARFCNACGKPAPGGWWKCPSCGKWVGNDSRFCPHCNQPLYPDDRAAMAGGVWRKEPEHFAQRFELGDIKRLLQNDLMIQEGTVAVVMDGGKIHGIIEAGRHNPDSLARKINWFGNPPPRSVVLVDIGEIVVPLHVEGLRTSEYFPIEFYGEVMLRFKGDADAARAFLGNILGENRSCTFKELSANFERAVRIAVDEMCVASTLDDLVRDPDRRIRLHERMSARLKEDLEACGLELVRVSSAEFTGREYEDYAAKRGDVDQKRRDYEYQDAIRHLADREAMEQYRDMDALRTYKETIDHEYRVSHATRDREFDLLKRNWEHDDIIYRRLLELEEQTHKHDLETNQVEHDIKIDEKIGEHERDKKVKDAMADVKVQDIHTTQDVKDAQSWLDVKERKLDIRQKDKSADAARRHGMTLAEMLMDAEDPDVRQALLDAMRLERNVKMTPEQLLAELGQDPMNAKLVEELKKLYQDVSNRADRNFSRVVDPLRVGVGGNIYRGDHNEAFEDKNQPNYKP